MNNKEVDPFAPPTSNILNGVVDYIITAVNPSELGIDVYDGLKQKEEMITKLTHESICNAIGKEKYFELEAQLTSTIGKAGMLDILLDRSRLPSDVIVSYPSIEIYITEDSSFGISSSSSIGPQSTIEKNKYYPYFIIASGGTLSLENFESSIVVLNQPENSDVDIILDDQMVNESYLEDNGRINFDSFGIYTIQAKLQHKTQQDLVIKTTLIVTVA